VPPEERELRDDADLLPGAELAAGSGGGTRLWLVRHAEVSEDWQGKAYGDLDVPLSAAGEERTVELALDLARLSPAAVVSSPLERARRLGEAVAAGSGLPLRIADELREIHRGRWQGRTVAELHDEEADGVAAFYADPWTYRDHGGESDEDLARRAWSGLAGPLAGTSGPLVVTTHYNVIRVLCATALGIPAHRSFGLRVDPGRAVMIEDSREGWRLHHSNVESPAWAAGLAREGGAARRDGGGS